MPNRKQGCKLGNMKVLMFGWEFPPHISGGLGTACFGLTRGLIKHQDLDITFVMPKASGDEKQGHMKFCGANQIHVKKQVTNHESFLRNIRFLQVKAGLVPYTSPEEYEKLNQQQDGKYLINTHFSGKFEFTGAYGPNLFQEIANYAITASTIAEQDQYDIIHAHDWLTYPAGIAAKQVLNKPLVIHVHATDFDRSGGKVNPIVFDIEKQGMEAADKIITVSNWTRGIVIEKYGIQPDKVVTIHNAVEPIDLTEHFNYQKDPNEKIVTFLGRITLQKGPEYFIEAAHKVLQKMDNVRFVMAGSGDMMHKMVQMAARLRIGSKFNFTGFLRNNDVYKMFALSDVYVMPSMSEPFGISPLEAMQSNVPVIISKQSGVAEVLKHAIKVDYWDIDAMADAIYGILQYKGLNTMFQKHGLEEVNNLKWDNTAKQVKAVYQETANKKISQTSY